MPMPAKPTRCPKCGGALEEGFLFDNVHGGGKLQAQWVEGAPVRSFWGGVKVRGRPRRHVHTWRCTACGFLESYAGDAVG